MAKKVRTPPPPRRAVQAPQRRDRRKETAPPRARGPWLYAGAGVVAIAAIVVVLVIVLGNGGGSTTTKATNYNNLPGIRRTKAPWPPDVANLADKLLPLGLSQLSAEALAFHIHQHLDIFVDGKKIEVPALIGINSGGGWLTELHTHDTRGVIHVESATKTDYTLGQLVAEWGVFLNSRCIGAYCNGLKWYVNGERQTGNPAGLVLKAHQEIAIVVGKPPKEIPSSYAFIRGE